MVGRIISVFLVTIAGFVVNFVIMLQLASSNPWNVLFCDPLWWIILGIGILGFILGLCEAETEQRMKRFLGLIFIAIGSLSALLVVPALLNILSGKSLSSEISSLMEYPLILPKFILYTWGLILLFGNPSRMKQ